VAHTSPTPAVSHRHVRGRKRIAELARICGDRRASPHHRSPHLELAQDEVDSLAIQSVQRPLHSLLPHDPLRVPVLAAGEGQEVGLAPLEALAQDRPGTFGAHRVPEARGKPPEEARSDDAILRSISGAPWVESLRRDHGGGSLLRSIISACLPRRRAGSHVVSRPGFGDRATRRDPPASRSAGSGADTGCGTRGRTSEATPA